MVCPPTNWHCNLYETFPPKVSVIAMLPEPLNVPVQPSPATPSTAVHCVALGTFQVSTMDEPVDTLYADELKVMFAAAALATTVAPEFGGSNTVLSVADPVLVVVSATEFQTAANEVKSAAPFEPLGAVGGLTGHDS